MDAHHHSFREFHEVAESAALPFNQPPPSPIGEISGFIALPIKRNARIYKLKTDQFTFQDLYRKPYESSTDRYQHLCFEKALMGYLAAVNKEDEKKVNSIIYEHHHDLKVDDYYTDMTNLRPNSGFANHKEENMILSHFPTDAQWHLLDQLRIHAGSPERSESGIDQLANYLAQLQFMESKFPFASGQISIGFIWYDAWNPNIEITTTSIQYEKASVLFNVAALYSQLGAQERLSSEEGKQKAAKYFQKAAAILIRLRDVYCQRLGIKVSKSSEFDEINLSSMATLMLAQAAECFFEKAIIESSTSQLAAVIAIYVSDLYEAAARNVRDVFPMATSRVPKNVVAQMNAKAQLYGAIAHFHTKVSTSNERAVGERLSRLQIVKKMITLSLGYAQELGGVVLKMIENYAESFTTALVCLDSANSDLHHNTPFDVRLLAPLRRPPRAIVNPEGLELFLSVVSSKKDILEGLMSSNNLVTLQEILSESRVLSHDGVVKVNAIMEKARKHVPSLEKLQISEAESTKLKSLKGETKNLIEALHSHQKVEYQICTKDLLSCLQKIQKYSEGNITEALNLVISQLKDHESKTSSSYLKLRALKTAIKSKHVEIFGSKAVEQLNTKYIKEISDFDARSWDEEKILALFTILDSEIGFSSISEKWMKAEKAVEEEKKNINNICEKGSKLLEDLKKLPAVAWAHNSQFSFATNVTQRKEYMSKLDKSIKELSETLEKSYENLKKNSTKTKTIAESLELLKKESGNVDNFFQTIKKCSQFRLQVISEIQVFNINKKNLNLRTESCRMLYICLEAQHGEMKEYIKHCKVSRDPYLNTIMQNPEEHSWETKILGPTLNCDELLLVLKHMFILPLDVSVNRQESFEKFWIDVQTKSTLKPRSVTAERNISSLHDLFEEKPKSITVNTTGDIKKRRHFSGPQTVGTRKEQIGIRMPPGTTSDGTVAVESNENGNGVVKGLSNIFRWIGGKPKTKAQGRSLSFSSPNENQSDSFHSIDSEEKEEDMIAIVMSENVRLRNKLANTRKELTGRDKKLSELEEKILDLEHSHQDLKKSRRTTRKTRNEQGTGSESSTSREFNVKEPNVYALATGIAAGMQAAHKAKRKGLNIRHPATAFEARMAYLKLDDKNLVKAIPNSFKKRDGFYSDTNANFELMKEDNDQIAKLLGK